MYKIVDTNEYIDQYNWSSLISKSDNDQIITISKSIIDSGNYFQNSPKYQTKENLFARPEPIWLKMRQSFIYSCFMYLGKEVRIKNIMSWVFMTSAKTQKLEINFGIIITLALTMALLILLAEFGMCIYQLHQPKI